MKHNNDSEKRINYKPVSREALSDSALEAVTGGARRWLAEEAVIRTGPGSGYSLVCYKKAGDTVYTTGYRVYNENDGYVWCELDDGNWIAGHLLD